MIAYEPPHSSNEDASMLLEMPYFTTLLTFMEVLSGNNAIRGSLFAGNNEGVAEATLFP